VSEKIHSVRASENAGVGDRGRGEGQVKKKEEYHLYSFRLAGRTGEASDGEDGGDNASSAGRLRSQESSRYSW